MREGSEGSDRETEGAISAGATSAGNQFHFDPDTYLQMVRTEVPRYDWLQSALAEATTGVAASAILDLGIGTGRTAEAVLARHPGATLQGIDENKDMLAVARTTVPGTRFTVGRLQSALPGGPFDLVVSSLAIHHLDAHEKADLFSRVAAVLVPGGRFAFADVVIPVVAGEGVVPVEDDYDKPSTVDDQLRWLRQAALDPDVVWAEGDLAILTADRNLTESTATCWSRPQPDGADRT